MRTIVLGAGAVGCWVGANIAKNGGSVFYVGREPFVQALNRDGLTVNFVDGQQWRLRQSIAATYLPKDVAELADAVFICTKAYAVDDAIQQLQDAGLAQKTWVVAFQNGLGSEEKCAAVFGAHRVLAATTTTPVSLMSAAEIKIESLHGGIGLTAFDRSQWSEELRLSARQLTKLLGAVVYTNWQSMKWSKLLLNSVGNASSAILDMPLKQLYKDKRMLNLEFGMLRETLAVMNTLNIVPMNLSGSAAAKLAEALGKYPDWVLRLVLKPRFIKGRGNKKPSFAYDAENKTGKSEVIYLNGAVAGYGADVGVATPINKTLTNVLMDIVDGIEPHDAWRGNVEKLLAACAQTAAEINSAAPVNADPENLADRRPTN